MNDTRIRPTHTVETANTCKSCRGTMFQREVGIAARPGEGLTRLMATLCRDGRVVDKR